MGSANLVKKFKEHHRLWVIYDAIKLFTLSTAVIIAIGFSTTIYAAATDATSPVSAWPAVTFVLLLGIISYLARVAELKEESKYSNIKDMLDIS